MIIAMAADHVNAVVGVHLRSFESFFLSFLGPRFLRLYYESIVDYQDSVGYVYLENDCVMGFVCGTTSPSRFYSHLVHTRWWRFALAALSAVLQRPFIMPRLCRALLYPGQTSLREDTATLMSIAVEPGVQGLGIGAKLVKAFLEAMRARRVRYVNLTTDQQDNDVVNLFYQRQGFHCGRTLITPEGREMNEYIIEL